MIFALPAICLLIGVWVAYWLGRARRWRAWMALLFVIVALVIGLISWISASSANGTGFDGVGEAALVVLTLIPLEFGMLLGAGVAAIRNRRSPKAE